MGIHFDDGIKRGNLFGLWKARDYLQGRFIVSNKPPPVVNTPPRKIDSMRSGSGKKACVNVRAKPPNDNPNAYTPIVFYSEDTHGSISKAVEMLELKTFYELGIEQYPKDRPLGTEWPCEVPSRDGVSEPGSIDIDALYKLVKFFYRKRPSSYHRSQLWHNFQGWL